VYKCLSRATLMVVTAKTATWQSNKDGHDKNHGWRNTFCRHQGYREKEIKASRNNYFSVEWFYLLTH
jgi:uncharacterized MAPEG superfamily protein